MNNNDICSARAHALESALVALVLTHPDPAAFADALDGLMDAGGLNRIGTLASPDVQRVAREIAGEVGGMARLEAARRVMPVARRVAVS